jgi:uncharacterized protein involved in exopolysaccharide biosynthesis
MYLPEGTPDHAEADAFDLRGSLYRVLDACRSYKLAIAATVIITVGLVEAYLALWPPIYTAEVLVVADSPKDMARSNFYDAWNVFRMEELKTEAELMTSRSVLTRVVGELGLAYDDVYHTFLHHAAYLWQESWVGKRYRSVKRFFFPKKKGPYDPTPEQIELARTVKDFGEGVRLEPVGESSVGRLVVMGPTPRVAEVANKVIDTYLDERKKRFVEEAQQANDALSAEVEKAAAGVRSLDAERKAYYEKNGVILEFELDKHEVAWTAELDARIREAQAEIKSLERKRVTMREQLEAESPEVVGLRTYEQNVLRERMKAARFELQTQLATLALRYRPESPEVQELQARIKQLEDQIAGQAEQVEASKTTTMNAVREQIRQRELDLTAELPRLQAGVAERKKTLAGYSAHVALLPEKLTQALAFQRELRRREQRYIVLSERLAMAQVSLATVASAPASLRVADYAMPPSDPSWPQTKLFRLGALVAGLIGGLVVAVMLDLLQGRVTRTRLLQTRIGFPVYGTLVLEGSPARALLAPAPHNGPPPDDVSRGAGDRSEDSA